LDQVKQKPSSTPTLLKDHIKAYQHLMGTSTAARNPLADEELELFQADLEHLKTDLGHQYGKPRLAINAGSALRGEWHTAKSGIQSVKLRCLSP
jgi:hypothetical protein